MSTRFRAAIALVFVLGTGLRLAHLRETLAPPLHGTLVQDARYYHDVAAGTKDDEGFMHLGYPYLVAAVYRLSGPRPAAMLLVQCVLGGLTAVLIALAAHRLLGDPIVATIAGLLYAVYRGALFYDALLLTPSTTNLVVAVAFLGAASFARTGRRRWLWVAGLAAGGAVLIRSNQILLVPLLALAVACAHPTLPHLATVRERARWGSTALLAALAVLGPVVVARGLAYGTFTITANGGINFWIGNNRASEGVYYEAPFLERLDAAGELAGFVDEARRRTREPDLSVAGASRYWLRDGLHEIGLDRGRWLRISGRKLALFWNEFETKTNVGMEFIREFSVPLDRLSLGFGLLSVLGLTGCVVVAGTPRRRALVVLGPFVLAPLLTCLLFFVSGEYRHPVAVPLAVLAAVTVGTLARSLIDPAGRRRVAPVLLVSTAAFSVVAYYPFPDLARVFDPALDFANHARLLAKDGRPEEARALLANAGEHLRGNLFILDARLAVSTDSALTGDRPSAVDALDAAAGILATDLRPGQPSYPDRFLEGLVVRTEERVSRLTRSPIVSGDPELAADAARLGGNGYREIEEADAAGDPETVLRLADAALSRAPRNPVPLAYRGRALLALGRAEEGLADLRRSLNGWPEAPEPARFLAEHFEAVGDRERARVAAEEARRRESLRTGARM